MAAASPSFSDAGAPRLTGVRSLLGAARRQGAWGAGPVGTLAAHLGALHLPADHEQEDAGARGRHGRGRAEATRAAQQLPGGALVALETDGVAPGLGAGPSAQARGRGGGAQAQTAALLRNAGRRSGREKSARCFLGESPRPAGGPVVQAAPGHETALRRYSEAGRGEPAGGARALPGV